MPKRQQAIIWTNADLIDWRIYAAPGGDELNGMEYGESFMTTNCELGNVIAMV